jgi:putative tRNA adenosine deaminase-associated protein
VAYFTAVLARSGPTWRARDVEVDEASTLDDLAESLRAVSIGDEPVLAVVEHEDEWFAIIRVDGDDDPRLFVSDLYAASRSSYAELLAPAADVEDLDADLDQEGEDERDDDLDQDEAETDGAGAAPEAVDAWAGETDLLDDLGVSGKQLRKLVEENSDDPGAVLGEVGEVVGFADLLQALR